LIQKAHSNDQKGLSKTLMSISTPFSFKQFSVYHDRCAMKVGTDGVLLGALAGDENPKSILEIGVGTGVVSLMLAQRFEEASLEAVEIDEAAATTAARNFSNSIFSDRLASHHIGIADFSSAQKFDLIVSNPPYFVNDLKNANHTKGIARHAETNFFDDLMAKVNTLLTEDGVFWLIFPVKQAQMSIEKAAVYHLKPSCIIELHSDKSKPAFRWMLCLAQTENLPKHEHFYIYESEKIYTEAYKFLLRDFFLGY
jgi:tRNA1Val (adenine37-N6)-methyltransferase